MAGKIINVPSHSLKEYRLLTGLTTNDNVMSKVSLRTRLCKMPDTKDFIHLNIPLISAAMQSVSGTSMGVALAQLGGMSVIPCSIPIESQAAIVNEIKRSKAGFQDQVITVSPSDKISKLLKINREKGYGKFPVTEGGQAGGKFLGMITTKNFDPRTDSSDTVDNHMRADVPTADSGISLGDANREMIKHGIDVLPVLKSGKLQSIVFKKDVQMHFSFPESSVDEQKRYIVGAAVSTQPADRKRVDALLDAGVDVIFIDASDGYSEFQADTLNYLRKSNRAIPIIGGNVITGAGFMHLAKAGFDGIKVGMGIGSGCTTQAQKGTGRGQATAIMEVCDARDEHFRKTGQYIPVISDGSISNSGQIMVALALGADAVMMGRFFAQFTESAGGLRQHPTMGPLKEYWMEASARARNFGRYSATSDTFFEEGVEGFVPHVGSLYIHLRETILKMRSSMSSCGCSSVTEFHDKAVVELQSSAAIQDADVHDIITK